jgi:hypothetical protein
MMKGRCPGPLSHHTTVSYDNKIYLYGGNRPNGTTNDALYVYDTALFKWDVIQHGANDYAPGPRDEHAQCMMNDSFVIFGGFIRGLRTNELIEFNFRKKRWTLIEKVS